MSSATPNATWQRWHDELELAGKARGYENWQSRAKRIIKRYRDERKDLDGTTDGFASNDYTGSRFNILWSNVQTLMPALLAKSPKPVVERRYLDRDDIGRTASVILERALLYEIDNGTYLRSLRNAVLDRLLPGRGVVWVRYEPKFMPSEKTAGTQGSVETENPKGVKADGDRELANPSEDSETGEEVASESVPVDYVDWKDFMTSPARTWEEVWWIDRKVYMTRPQLIKRFGKEKGSKPTLDWKPNKETKTPGSVTTPVDGDGDRAVVHETWDLSRRKVTWWADSYKDDVLDEKDDPLKLEGFWPVPRPLYATLTNDTLIPVPDYAEYQDQANELDDLTNRITNLVAAIKISGLYDASIPELQRIFAEGKENELVGVADMSQFMMKAGPDGMGVIWLAPLDKMVAALKELYVAREQVKQSLYEITGISDIVRGSAAAGGAKTATEQRIKGQFASMRLNDMQAEVARFARDTLRIMGEIIAEHFDPMTLFLVSGYEQYAKEQFPPDQPQPMMGHNGGPPLDSPQVAPSQPPAVGAPGPGSPPGAGMQPMMMPPDPAMVAKQKAAAVFKEAIALLRNDKLRGFRIDIETDSLVEPDQQATQQARTELLSAISQFLPQAIEAGAAVPELKPLMARLLMFFLRGFKASRDIESAFEQFIDDVTKEAANPKPKPPSPEEIKAQAEIKKAEMQVQQMQLQAQLDQQQGQQDMAMEQQKMQLEREKMEMEFMHEQRMLQLKEREAMLKIGVAQQSAQIKSDANQRDAHIDEQAAMRDAQLDDRAAERDAEAAEHTSELAVQTAEATAAAKQKAAKKPEARA